MNASLPPPSILHDNSPMSQVQDIDMLYEQYILPIDTNACQKLDHLLPNCSTPTTSKTRKLSNVSRSAKKQRKLTYVKASKRKSQGSKTKKTL